MTHERDPSDDAVEQALRQVSLQDWAGLWADVDAVNGRDGHLTWDGGQQVDVTVVDGVERPVIQMPYATYSDVVNDLIQRLYALGLIIPFDWPNWDLVATYRGPNALDGASAADAVRMITAIVRADRFTDGTIGATLEDGTLPAALRRLRRWQTETNG